MYITKRDGTKEPFNKDKIVSTINKAFESVDGKVDEYAITKSNNIANYILEHAKEGIEIEEIQDLVEKGLMSTKRKDVAKEYIKYREKRNINREKNSKLRKQINEKLTAVNVQNQNANVDEHSFGGRIGEANSVLMKDIALNEIMSEKSRRNHLDNVIYIHDLDSYAVGSHNCLSIPFDDLLANGFKTRQTDIRPANSINTAFQLVAVIFQLQSLNQFGGCSSTHLDWTMVPYVRKSFYKHYIDGLTYILKDARHFSRWFTGQPIENNLKIEDIPITNEFYTTCRNIDCYPKNKLEIDKVYDYALNMTKKELKKAVEGMYHNLNTLQSRSGNQLPFTSINYGTCTLTEGRMVIKALLEGSIKGVGKFHKTPIFPCSIFKYKKGCNDRPDTPNYDLYRLALKSTAQRLYPNYANVNWSGNEGYDENDPRTEFSTMGCRTANGWDINGFGQLKDGRGNICPVTIIMPTLAMRATTHWTKNVGTKDNNIIEYFFQLLDKAIHDAKDMLIERFDYICSQNPASAKFMYENNVMAGYKPEEGIRSALKHGTLAIGNLGLAETLQILIGCDHTTDEGMKLAKRIYKLFSDRCKEFKNEYKLNFGVYNTPAENLCYTAMQKFKKKYGEIPNVSDKEFFTNSMHVPVWKEISPFEKIDIESELTGYSSAGCITYVEFDASCKYNIDALETIVNYAMDKDIPYFAINVPVDMCNDCGYEDVIDDTCPECGGHNITHLRRVTGYLSGDYKTAFNKGKQEEVNLRVKHNKFQK